MQPAIAGVAQNLKKRTRAKAERDGGSPAPAQRTQRMLEELPEWLRKGAFDKDISTQADVRLALARLVRAAAKGDIPVATATKHAWLLEQLSKAIERQLIEAAAGGGAPGAGPAGFLGFKVVPAKVATDPADPADAAIERNVIDVPQDNGGK